MRTKLVVDIGGYIYEFIGFDSDQDFFVSYNETGVSLNQIRKIGNWDYECSNIRIGNSFQNEIYWKPLKPINAHVVFNELIGQLKKNAKNYWENNEV